MRRNGYLIYGTPRAQLADALLEYRAFAAAHTSDPLAPELLDVARKVHLALHEERAALRGAGLPGKPNAHLKLTARQRGQLRTSRRARLADKATTTERSAA